MIAKNICHAAVLAGSSVLFRAAPALLEELQRQTPEGRHRKLRSYANEACCASMRSAIRWLQESYLGKDPGGIEEHWNRSDYLLSRWRNGPPAMTALSAIDIALWDIEGKRLNLPVWWLLQGSLRPHLRVYHTHWNAPLTGDKRTPAAFAAWAHETRARGWTAVKWSIPMGLPEKERAERLVRELEAVRDAIGNSMDLALEASETFSGRAAIELAQAISPYKPLWIEEPTLRESPGGLGDVAAKSPRARDSSPDTSSRSCWTTRAPPSFNPT